MALNSRSKIVCKLLLLVCASGALPAISAAQNLIVTVRERSGEPLAVEAFVRVTWQGRGQTIVGTTGGGKKAVSTATFTVEAGEYDIEVEAVGYETATEHATLEIASRTVTVYVFMTRAGAGEAAKAPTGVTMAPKAQKELEKSLEAMKEKKYDEARKHLEKAQKMAPSNPDIMYMIGVLDYTVKDLPAARKQFETVVASYPTHERSLMMLGHMQYEAKEYKEAEATLQKAVDAEEKNWRAHYALALASAFAGDLPKAGVEAARVAELNPEKAAAMKMLGAKLLMLQGKNEEAKLAFEGFIKAYPQDPAVPEAQKYLAQMEEAKKKAAAAASTAEALKASSADDDIIAAGKNNQTWAPPDVDAGVPPTTVGVACSLDGVMDSARKRILKQLTDLERFSATERVEHQKMEKNGTWSSPLSKDFYYLISVYHRPTVPYYFVEDRTTDTSNSAFPTGIATRGLVSLGFMIINPAYAKDFDFSCEGLSNWNGKPTWQVYFVQRRDASSDVRSWEYKGKTYTIPLKGRLWIGANTYSIVRLETALREPVSPIQLDREQLSVDYGPVKFQSAKTQLWLPLQGEMYFQLMGRRYHHTHTLSNYLLFGVDTKHKINVPTPTESPEQ
jgi:TolA-binding protein